MTENAVTDPAITIAEALREAAQRLEPVSDTARLDVELLMSHALDVSRSDLLLRHMRDPVPASFAVLVERREQHEPVAYICGVQEFYGLEFLVTRDVLIPRGDSETLVRAGLESAPYVHHVLDCGTGSGALLLALLEQRPFAQAVGVDRSLAALAVAAANAARLGLADRSRFVHCDWNVPGWSDDLGRFDLILANPPYVETEAQLSRSVRDHEPAEALFAGAEGLDDYRVLIPQLRGLLTDDGVAVLEIGATQADSVAAIAALNGFATTLYRDLANRPRAVALR